MSDFDLDDFITRFRNTLRAHPWFAGLLALTVMFGMWLGGLIGDWLMT